MLIYNNCSRTDADADIVNCQTATMCADSVACSFQQEPMRYRVTSPVSGANSTPRPRCHFLIGYILPCGVTAVIHWLMLSPYYVEVRPVEVFSWGKYLCFVSVYLNAGL